MHHKGFSVTVYNEVINASTNQNAVLIALYVMLWIINSTHKQTKLTCLNWSLIFISFNSFDANENQLVVKAVTLEVYNDNGGQAKCTWTQEQITGLSIFFILWIREINDNLFEC